MKEDQTPRFISMTQLAIEFNIAKKTLYTKLAEKQYEPLGHSLSPLEADDIRELFGFPRKFTVSREPRAESRELNFWGAKVAMHRIARY